MIDVNKKIIKIQLLFRFWERVRDFISSTKADRFYADKSPWLIKGIISASKTYIHQIGKKLRRKSYFGDKAICKKI